MGNPAPGHEEFLGRIHKPQFLMVRFLCLRVFASRGDISLTLRALRAASPARSGLAGRKTRQNAARQGAI
jgi:hypothetical protein